jgi:hypothetical protein
MIWLSSGSLHMVLGLSFSLFLTCRIFIFILKQMEKSVAKKNKYFVLGVEPFFWGKSSTIISQKK